MNEEIALDERTVPDDVVRARVEQCLACSISGHFPTVGDEARSFAAALDDEALGRWENYTERRLPVSCCGRAKADHPSAGLGLLEDETGRPNNTTKG